MKPNRPPFKLMRYEVVFPVLVLCFLISLLVMGLTYPWRIARLPVIIAGATVLLLLIEIGKAVWVNPKKDRMEGKKSSNHEAGEGISGGEGTAPGLPKRRLISTLAAMAFFLISFHILGYLITALVLCVGLIAMLGFRNHLLNVVFSVLCVGGSFAVFAYFLGVNLPWGILLQRFFE